MGSSGMKKKGRKHLPKVGTPAERTWEAREARHDVVGNLGIHPEKGGAARLAYWIIGVVIALALVLAVVALVALD